MVHIKYRCIKRLESRSNNKDEVEATAQRIPDLAGVPGKLRTISPIHRIAGLVLLLVIYLSISVSHAQPKQELYALWAYPSPISDLGFSFSADQTRVEIENLYQNEGIAVYSRYIQSLSVTDCVDTLIDAILSGISGKPYDLVLVYGAQYTSCVNQVSELAEFSNVRWYLSMPGLIPTAKVNVGVPKLFQARFLQGMLCAQASKTGKIASVTSMPFDFHVVSQTTNAFSLGAKFVNPNITVYAAITGTFLDEVTETKATRILIDAGADCIAEHQNDLTVHYETRRQGVYSIGYATDIRYFAGETVLSSVLLSNFPMVETVTRMILNDSWQGGLYLDYGMETRAVQLSAYSTAIDPLWRVNIQEAQSTYFSGNYHSSFPFCTPVFNDPKYMNINTTEEYMDGVRCLKNEYLREMLGLSSDFETLVEYNSTNSAYINVFIKWKNPAALILISLIGILLFMALVSMVDLVWNRASPVYHASSPLFCFLILLGIIIAGSSPLFWIGYRTNFNCMALWWFYGIGHALIFSCILAKNWRIWKIFSSGTFKFMAIMNTELLLKFVAVIMGLEILILVLWTIFDPQVPHFSQAPELQDDQIQVMCQPKSGRAVFFGPFLAYNVLLLVPAALISYRIRSAKEEYNESNSVALIVYSSLILIPVIIGISAALPHNYQVSFYMGAYGIVALMFVSYLLLFIPKLWKIHTKKPTKTDTSGKPISTLHSQPAFDSVLYSIRGNIARSRTAAASSSMVNPSRLAYETTTEDSTS